MRGGRGDGGAAGEVGKVGWGVRVKIKERKEGGRVEAFTKLIISEPYQRRGSE